MIRKKFKRVLPAILAAALLCESLIGSTPWAAVYAAEKSKAKATASPSAEPSESPEGSKTAKAKATASPSAEPSELPEDSKTAKAKATASPSAEPSESPEKENTAADRGRTIRPDFSGALSAAVEKAAQHAKELSSSVIQEEAAAREAAEAEIMSHVSGIRHFTTVEGKHPDVLAGIAWDDTITEVVASDSEVNWDKPGKYPLTYTAVTKEGNRAAKTIEIEVYLDLEHYLYGMEGAVYIPVDGTFDPMEHIVTEPEIETIEPDMGALDTSKEGEYLISYKLTAPGGRFQTAVRKVTVGQEPPQPGFGTSYGQGTATYVENVEGYSTVTDLGLWRLTAYMDTPSDQGQYVGQTASGAPLVAGRTVAVSSATCARLGLQFGDRLMVDGHVYVLEDHGGSAMYDSDWLDIFVDNEADEYSDAFNRYAEVYLLR